MTNIHLIGGEKGGVGTSLVARIVAPYLIDKSIPFLGFDTDRSHGALMRFYSGYASPVVMDRYEALDVIVEAAAVRLLRVLGLPEAAAAGVDLLHHALVQAPDRDDLRAEFERALLLARLLKYREVVAAHLVAHQHVFQPGAEAVEQLLQQVDRVLA